MSDDLSDDRTTGGNPRLVIRCTAEDLAFAEEQGAGLGVDKSTFVRMLLRQARVGQLKFMLLPPIAEPQLQPSVARIPSVFTPQFPPGYFTPDPRAFQAQPEPSVREIASDVQDHFAQPDEEQSGYRAEGDVEELPAGTDTDDLVEQRLAEMHRHESARAPVALYMDRGEPRHAMSLGSAPKIGQIPVRPPGR